jgi:putative addiction module CopG family antidote
MTISLPAELEKAVKQKVESGFYSDASDVIRESLRQTLFREIDEEILRNEALKGFQDLEAGRVFPIGSVEEFKTLARAAS